jgi:hypothetical protein
MNSVQLTPIPEHWTVDGVHRNNNTGNSIGTCGRTTPSRVIPKFINKQSGSFETLPLRNSVFLILILDS